jgi:hypothetical protein
VGPESTTDRALQERLYDLDAGLRKHMKAQEWGNLVFDQRVDDFADVVKRVWNERLWQMSDANEP